MLTTQKRGLDGTALKTIALVLMVMDHSHYFFGIHRSGTGMVLHAGAAFRSPLPLLHRGGLRPHP